jgi:hypothetical protein
MEWCFGDQYLVDIDPAIWESLIRDAQASAPTLPAEHERSAPWG